MTERRLEDRPIETLIPYARNARTHSDAQVAQIAASIKEFGFTNPVLVDGANGIIAGHGRVLAARKLGMAAVPCMEFAHLSDTQRRAYILADNKLAEHAGWDQDLLRLEIKDLQDADFDVSLAGFTADDLAALAAGEEREGLTAEDAIPEVRKEGVTVVGDLWLLRPHRLLCGDSTNVDQVSRLMNGERAVLFATDPPYLVSYDGMNHPSKGAFDNKKRNKDWSDSYQEQGWDDEKQGQQFYLDFYKTAIAAAAITENAAWYCWHASKRQAMLEDTWVQCGAFAHQQIIWVKSRPVLSHSIFMWAHEPCLMGWVKGHKPRVNRGGVKEFPRSVVDMDTLEHYPLTIWDLKSSEIECKDHPTSKPVRVFVLPIQLHTLPGELCYEPFSGSGSQLIAAEKTGRRCYGLELSPVYCDVIIRRWQSFTGQQATLEGDGRTFDQIAASRGVPTDAIQNARPQA